MFAILGCESHRPVDLACVDQTVLTSNRLITIFCMPDCMLLCINNKFSYFFVSLSFKYYISAVYRSLNGEKAVLASKRVVCVLKTFLDGIQDQEGGLCLSIGV